MNRHFPQRRLILLARKPIDDARFNEVTGAMASLFDGGFKHSCAFDGSFGEMVGLSGMSRQGIFSGSSAGPKETAAIMDDTDHDNGTTLVL